MTGPFERNSGGRGDASAHHQRGLVHLSRNQTDLALAEFAQAVQLDGRNAEFLKSLGNAQRSANDAQAAIGSYRRSLECEPDYLPSLYNLALTLRETGVLDEAERHFRRVLELAPCDVDARLHLGSLLQLRSSAEEAARIFRLVLQQAPDNAYAHYQLGLACKNLGRTDEAMRCYRKALELDPGAAEAHNDLGNVLQAEGSLDEAIDHYRDAVRLAPGLAIAHNNLGSALVRKGRLDEALACLRKSIELRPDVADPHFNLGHVHSQLGERERALSCYRAAARLRPEDATVREGLLFELQNTCEWSQFAELSELQLHSLRQQSESPISPFSLLSIPSTAQEQLRCAVRFSAMQSRAVRQDRERLAFRFDRGERKRLTIGYLSADFHAHATAYLTAELFEVHDRGRFRINGYSYGPDDGSAMRARLQGAFDRFVDVAHLSHADAAAAIHADGVDILVDLKGHTLHARTQIMALRPAPIQVNYLGYPGTMGADFIDYLVGDRFATPPEQAQDYSECLVLMPGSYQANDRKRPLGDAPSRQELGLPVAGLVFCCFNQAYKIMPDVFSVWMRVLQAVPGSVLWLLDWSPSFARNLRHEAGARGTDPGRLIFAPVVPFADHLRRISAADLFLDTQPYNAHTTASDALWAGLPLLTCAGKTFASRVAGSLLSAVGMPELITRSMAEYEALALRLARSPDELATLKMKLARNRTTAALFDTPEFTRRIEMAYVRMWGSYVAGDAPRVMFV